jgi:hypothetical protein
MARDDFKEATKVILGNRVAWKCSFPGCDAVTIGPGHKNNKDVVKLGEAAHIHAAAKGGPRYDPSMTPNERKSIDNGVWMCRMHARIIDQDYVEYSAETLRQWKRQAENRTYNALKIPGAKTLDDPTTIIQLGRDLVFFGKWVSANANYWMIEVNKFLYGDEIRLKEYCSTFSNQNKYDKYVVIASQGDGRWIKDCPSWELVKHHIILKLRVERKIRRTSPHHIGNDIDLDSFKLITGIDNAKQLLSTALSIQPGGLLFSPKSGSYFSQYYADHQQDHDVLSHLFKLEVARLASLENKKGTRPLDFINRVLDVSFFNSESNSKINIAVKIEWGDGKITTDDYQVYVGRMKRKANNQTT